MVGVNVLKNNYQIWTFAYVSEYIYKVAFLLNVYPYKYGHVHS